MFITHERDAVAVELVGRSSKLLIGPASGSAMISHNVAYFVTGHAPGHVHLVEEEVFYVAAGEGEVWIEGTPYHLRPGTAVHTPQGVVHNIHTTSREPLRLLGLFSPHAVPGAYANLPPQSRDLDAPPTNRVSFVVYEDERSTSADDGGILLRTERIEVAIQRLATGGELELAASGRDLVVHVLEGTGALRYGPTATPVETGTAFLLTDLDAATLHADTPMCLLEARATGWRPSDTIGGPHQGTEQRA
jgi:uncharacterized cupin superfamily protein